MIHFSCDRCKRPLEHDELRYVVRLEIAATIDHDESEEWNDDRDHLLEIEQIVDNMEAFESDLVGPDVYERRRFDLCPICYNKYTRNPLGVEASSPFEFSDN